MLIIMDTVNSAALCRLVTWLSPAYPVGAFSYSHGLEWLVEQGSLKDRKALTAWIADVLLLGSGRSDAILFAQAYHAVHAHNWSALNAISELAAALAPSAERFLETTAQGNAFAAVTRAAWGAATLDRLAEQEVIAYPVAVAAAAADHGIPLAPALTAYIHAFAANLVSAGVRLIPLGHTDGQHCIAALEPVVERCVETGLAGTLDDIGSAAVVTDIAAMNHETQYTRLFRS